MVRDICWIWDVPTDRKFAQTVLCFIPILWNVTTLVSWSVLLEQGSISADIPLLQLDRNSSCPFLSERFDHLEHRSLLHLEILLRRDASDM